MEKLPQNIPFVFMGLQSWFLEIGSNARNMAVELSKTHPVLFINPALDRITLLRKPQTASFQKHYEILKNKESLIQQVAPNLWVYSPDVIMESINWLKVESLHDYLNKKNNDLYAKAITDATAKLGWDKFVLFNDNEIIRALHLKEMLNPLVSIYYIRDYLAKVAYWMRHGTRLEPTTIANYDLVVTNSPLLADYALPYNKNTYSIGQGCDVVRFLEGRNAEKPEPMKAIDVKVIGYIGALVHFRLNIPLLEKIAASFPQYKLVLVGPEDDEFKASALHQMPNVVFIPNQPESILPAYINSFDVCINPQLSNEVTDANYPRKIDEYLAVGKPVVATYTRTMEGIFGDYAYLAKSDADYIALIAKALNENSPSLSEKRSEFASHHTWEENVSQLLKHTQHTLQAKQGYVATH
jgi:glycosyltransferase involved in cell wall biosynthesis